MHNPLDPIRTGVALLRSVGRSRCRASTIMERQLGHIVRLIDDLLDVSRISRSRGRALVKPEGGYRPPLDQASVLSEITALLPRIARNA
ncbi:hypothetical protein [Pseudoduganella lutea]|uniref:hypothetical protein n=1 Tax=Pseudoduganella lutea TaxID=321985 RepID=UPI001A936D9C